MNTIKKYPLIYQWLPPLFIRIFACLSVKINSHASTSSALAFAIPKALILIPLLSAGLISTTHAGNTFLIGNERQLGIEAESVSTTAVGNSKWAIISSGSEASGRKYLRKQGGGWYNSSGTGPSAKIPFKAARPGNYDVWLRAFAPDGGSDSLHIDFDNNVSTYHFSSKNLGQWVWVKVRTIGVRYNSLHTLTLWAREDNLRIDKIAFRPEGAGAPPRTWISKKRSFEEAFSLAIGELSRKKSNFKVKKITKVVKASGNQSRDIGGFSLGFDVSGFGYHGEIQGSILADPEHHEIGISFSYGGGLQNPDMAEAGAFALAVMGDDGLRMATVVEGESVNTNTHYGLPGTNLGIDVNRITPVYRDEDGNMTTDALGLTETGIRVDTATGLLPGSAGLEYSQSHGYVIDLEEVIETAVEAFDNAIGIGIEAITDNNPSSDSDRGSNEPDNGGNYDKDGNYIGDPGRPGPRSNDYKPFLQPSNGVLSIEAELALINNAQGSSKWAVISRGSASAGKALHKQGGSFYRYSGEGPGARLEFKASRSGSHDVWLRAYAPNNGSDSLHVDLDGSASTYHFSGGDLARWVWVKVRTVRLSAGGQHVLTLWAREDNLRIDKVVIQPAGRGAPN